MKTRNTFTENEISAFKPAEKIGLVACTNPEGQVHMTLITSIMASGPQQITLGQFCMGRSKWYMQQKPEIGFLIMTLDKRMWRGKARWTHKMHDGPEFEIYNDMPMFRYNAYFGINTVHYLDIIETFGEEKLPMGKIIPAAVLTRSAKSTAATAYKERILKPFAENLFNGFDTLKFLSYIGSDGIPSIIPVIQAQASDSRRLVFSTLPFRDELRAIPADTTIAIFGLNLKMQSVLVRGVFTGFQSYWGIQLGVMNIEWVYNSMPPCHDQIYPEWDIEPVSVF
jgi:hypothetical protein